MTDDIRLLQSLPSTTEYPMLGRKHTTATLVATLGLVAFIVGCRGEASTGSSNIPSSEFAAGLRLQTGDVQSGPLAEALPQALTVRVVDAGGEPVQGASVTWSVLSGGGTVNPPTGVSNAQGLVSTTWTLGPALGANSVRAYLTRGYKLDSATFTATATVGAPVVVTLDSTALPPATAVVGTTVTLRFTVKDQFGNLIPGATVNFTVPGGSGSVSPASAVSDANGLASTVWTVGTQVGLRSASAALPSGSTVGVSLSTTPGTGRVLTRGSPDPTAAVAGSTLSPVTVLVADQFGNPVAGELVSFNTGLPAGITVTPASMASDATGAASTTIRLGNGIGADTVRATLAAGGSVAFGVRGTMTFRDVYAGNYFACGIGTNDRVYCWGFGQDGQLGAASLVSRSGPRWPVASAADTANGPYPTFRELTGGRSHTCGVGVGRTVFCWGLDVEGRQFPSAASAPVRRAFAVESPILTVNNARTVSAGEAHSCMLTMGGVAYCTGNNERGQLGNGAVSAGAIAVAVDGNAGRPTVYAGIATGERHTCGIRRLNPADMLLAAGVVRPSQRIWCWGANDAGQLGNATTRDTAFADTVKIPALVPLVVGFDSTSLVAGAAHSCALENADAAVPRRAFCWGSNSFGQLGKGAIDTLSHNTLRVVAGGHAFVRLYAGEFHTCGLTAAGNALCWGRNDRGQLTGAITAPIATPTLVGGVPPLRALALGELFTCGISGTPGTSGTSSPTGTIFCWGDNEFGQLGRNGFSTSGHAPLVPAPIGGQ
jgi:alpha-tubulin suppressor-like RCC1 family protein